jgi:hypothetical protein
MNELLENTMKAIKYNDKEVYSKLIKREIPNYLRDLSFYKGNNDLEVKSGIGMGNDALVPWVAIVDRNITKNDKVKKGVGSLL